MSVVGLADQVAHQRALDVEGEGVSGFVNFIRTKRGLVATVRILRQVQQQLAAPGCAP